MKSPEAETCPHTVTVRRNPHRRARPTPATAAPRLPGSSSSNLPDIPSFPIDDILSIDISQNPNSDLSSSTSLSGLDHPVAENLKVYLRIRPLVPLKGLTKSGNARDQNARSRAKNVWPQIPGKRTNCVKERNATKKKMEYCVTVNDSGSVTLSPPLALQESKRIKSEVYGGFSYVFSAESSQDEVYERMVNPLVEDFLRGQGGMLAALGPSGSGKTHTVFGSPREPGMVPLALRRIFKQVEGSDSQSLSSFYMSIFEICSERGKGERLLDLCSDDGDQCVQRKTSKGLQEVIVSDAGQAESLIARGMLKRATAMTNSNSQSSRSQCIINIRRVDSKFDGDDLQSNNAVLSIVDLAGAEREKRTGNQGTRLLESNFINNTSMVFGLCLRSLLEHQKNPKKPLQKHFQNSMLTRYLRDYLEGKKRMMLLLTVKPGEEDYLDTSYLLRQASPLMKITFNKVEEQSNFLCNKRPFQMLSRSGQPKKMKVSGPDVCATQEGMNAAGDEEQFSKEEAQRTNKLDANDCVSQKLDGIDSQVRDRNNQIMQNFAKVLWKVLKQYNEKLKVAENEIQSLNENLRNEKQRYLELEKEDKDKKSCCTCSKENSTDVDVQSTNLVEPDCNTSPTKCDSTLNQEEDVKAQAVYLESNGFELLEIKQGSDATVRNADVHLVNNSCLYTEYSNEQNHKNHIECNSAAVHGINQQHETCPGNGSNAEILCESKDSELEDNHHNVHVTGLSEFTVRSCQSHLILTDESSPSKDLQSTCEDDKELFDPLLSPKEDISSSQGGIVDMQHCEPDTSSKITNLEKQKRKLKPASTILLRDTDPLEIEDDLQKPKELFDPILSPKEGVSFSQGSIVDVQHCEPDTSCNSMKLKKPRRRLQPASTIFLRDTGPLDIEDDLQKPKGNKGVKKLAASESKRSEGSISLIRMLKNNLLI